jgi:predicted phosphodiesterase
MAIIRWAALSCTHAPLEDWDALNWAAEQIQEHQPDVLIHLGDLLEASSASKFPKEDAWDIINEYEHAENILDALSEAAPGAERLFLEGNHDHNIRGYARIPKDLRPLVDYRRHIPSFVKQEWIPGVDEYVYDRNRGVYRLGQVTFGHGWATGVSADKQQSVDLGMPYGLFVSGHTHKPVQVTQTMMNQTTPLPYWYANAGTLRNIWSTADDWMRRKRRHLWGQAIVLGDAWVDTKKTSSIPGQRRWDAETRFFRMYNDGEPT